MELISRKNYNKHQISKLREKNIYMEIDYILVKNRVTNQIKFCKTYQSADCDSDHKLVNDENYEMRTLI